MTIEGENATRPRVSGESVHSIFSTRDIPAKDGFAYWRDVMCRELLALDIRRLGDAAFFAEARMAPLFDLTFLEWESSPSMSVRDRHHVDRTNCDYFVLHHLVAGRRSMQQGDTELVMEPGEMCLVDTAHPYSTVLSEPSKIVSAKIPRQHIEGRLGASMVKKIISRRIEPAPGSASFYLAKFLRNMSSRLALPLDVSGELALRDVMIDMSTHALAFLINGQPPPEKASTAIPRLEAVIDDRLSDPSLDREAIAAAAGVSVRYADQMLNEQGTSITELLLERRLAKCAVALRDPKQQHRQIKEIAYRYGFGMRNFLRSFKRRYGVTPTEFRITTKLSPDK